MYNANNITHIFYNCPTNFNRTYAQNARRGIGCETCTNAQEVAEAMAKIEAAGFTVRSIYTGTGKRIG